MAGAVGWGVEVLHHLDSSWTKKRLSDLLDAFGASGGDQEVRSREEVRPGFVSRWMTFLKGNNCWPTHFS